MIISEQSLPDGKTGEEYEKAGYTKLAKVNVDSKKLTSDVKQDANGKYWFKENKPSPNKDTSTSTPTLTTTTTSVKKADESKFACIKNSNTKGKNLQQTKDNPEAYSYFDTDGTELTFWDNGDFTIWDGNMQAPGKWKCVGNNNFEANVEWKGTTHYYRSVTNQWSVTPNAKKINENVIKKIVSKNLKSLIK